MPVAAVFTGGSTAFYGYMSLVNKACDVVSAAYKKCGR